MKKGIISLGEALIDFIPVDSENLVYQKSPGGAPANVAVGLARLGAPSSFLGKVGDDVLGTFLKETLQSFGVNTDHMLLTKEAKTGAVFITLAEGGERSFDFYIDPSADRFLHEENLDVSLFAESKILHYGSISMISGPSKSATVKAVELAREYGMIVSYDPNLRLSLWENEETAKETILSMFGKADLIKISEEELEFLTGESDIEKGVEKLAAYNIPLLFITMGSEGSYAFTKNGAVKIDAMRVNAVDTTGAGDAFVSGILYQLHELETHPGELTSDELKRIGRFASVSGGLAASVKGAMTALPTLGEVEDILKKG
ncbi:aminoimidazole riboside kinase [Metabacillus indicus]|uniref:aminoimidazole riboside kinase n=1 Tax=Metabacillus indicus TaxID=246786 RepID=UPI002A06CDC3|nr:aminoimidazole riboside kinase [Metabacillus indicus]MDX8289764.1 aminoimidazole riboside kinase [Metabacillus indicus]